MDEQTFVQRFNAIKKQGWIPSRRQGPTGIGFTLETALGLTETNVAIPDLGAIELKAHRVGTQSLITLFTFNRAVWKMHPLTAIRRYVVGNRKVKGVLLPTDLAIRHFFEAQGFTHIATHYRHIPNKRMPAKNSPSNVAGSTEVTMTQETVVVMKRT